MMLLVRFGLPIHGVHSASLQRFRGNETMPNRDELVKLRDRIVRIASQDSSNNPIQYQARQGISPLTGHCAAVADYVQQQYGGVAVRGVIRLQLNGQETTEVHYWNRIGDQEFDLTGCQYGGDGFHPLDDPQGQIQPMVNTQGSTVAFIKVEAREIRPQIKPSPWFKVLKQRLDNEK